MAAPYAHRAITVTFRIGTGSFGEGGANTLTASNLRVEAHVEHVMMPNTASAVARISGLTLDTINRLQEASLNWETRADTEIAIQAGDFGETLTTVFNGNILSVKPDFDNMPDTALLVTAIAGREISMKPMPPVSINAGVSAEQAAEQVLKPWNYTVKNHGVTSVLAYPYFDGTTMSQLRSLLQAAHAHGYLDTTGKTLHIWPKSKDPDNANTITVSPKTGMVGYPSVEFNKVLVRHLWDPAFIAYPGAKLKIEGSELTSANKVWNIGAVNYDLASEVPGGPWLAVVQGYLADNPGNPQGWRGLIPPGM